MSSFRHLWALVSVFALSFTGSALAQKKPVPPAQPKPEPLPAAQLHARGLPTGAVAKLGQARLRHAAQATCVVFAPDSKTFTTGGADGTIRIWSVETGEQINLLQKPKMSVTNVMYTHSGKQLAVFLEGDSLVRFLDPTSLKELSFTPFTSRQYFAISGDGKLMATADGANNATVFEVENELPKLELADAKLFTFRPDGKALAAADPKGTVTVYLVTGGKPIFTAKHDGEIRGLAFSPNGKQLAVGTQANDKTSTVRIYEPGKKEPVAEIAGMHLPKAWLNAETLVCSNDSDVGVYNLAKKDWAARIKGVSGEYAVSPDGKKLAATGNGIRVRLWDLSTGEQLHAKDDTFPDPALLVGSPDGKTLFVITTDAAYLWRVGERSAEPAGHLPGVAVAAAVNGKNLVVATADEVLLYGDFDPTKPLPKKPTKAFENSGGAKAVAVSANGEKVAWATGGKVIVANTDEKGTRRSFDPKSGAVYALCLNPTGDRLGVLARLNLRVWDVSDKAEDAKEVWKGQVPRGSSGAVAFSPNGKYVVATASAVLHVFDAADGTPSEDARLPLLRLERSSDNGAVQHAAFSPDSRTILIGSDSMYGRVELWELATEKMVRAFTTGYGGTSRLCVFPGGKRAASAGAEEAVTVWDLTSREGKPAPTDAEITAAVKELSSGEAAVGYPAARLLALAGNRSVKPISESIEDTLAVDKRTWALIEDLGSKTVRVREKASTDLLAQGKSAVPALMLAVDFENAEVHSRARTVLDKINENGGASTLHFIRVVQALEEIGSMEAVSVLKQIANLKGRAAEEAKSALARLAQLKK